MSPRVLKAPLIVYVCTKYASDWFGTMMYMSKKYEHKQATTKCCLWPRQGTRDHRQMEMREKVSQHKRADPLVNTVKEM